jgi:nitric oxide reductase activation protein
MEGRCFVAEPRSGGIGFVEKSLSGNDPPRPGGRYTAHCPEPEENSMDETTFQTKLAELMGEIATLPASEREKLETLAKETQDRHSQLKKSINSLQESLDWLRLSVKYLVFDLEATRRENAYLRQMMESNSEEGNS